MSDASDNSVLYTAIYSGVDSALEDLKAFDDLHKVEMLGKYDAAVIDQKEGKPHIVKRADHPGIRIIPEAFGEGTLPRKELHDAAQELGQGEAALIVVGEPTLAKGFEKAITRAAKTAKRDMSVATDELAKELTEALKS